MTATRNISQERLEKIKAVKDGDQLAAEQKATAERFAARLKAEAKKTEDADKAKKLAAKKAREGTHQPLKGLADLLKNR